MPPTAVRRQLAPLPSSPPFPTPIRFLSDFKLVQNAIAYFKALGLNVNAHELLVPCLISAATSEVGQG